MTTFMISSNRKKTLRKYDFTYPGFTQTKIDIQKRCTGSLVPGTESLCTAQESHCTTKKSFCTTQELHCTAEKSFCTT